MKRISILLILLTATLFVSAQAKLDSKVIPLKLKNGEISMKKLKPLISVMGNHQVVGLGEGTHGTKEFNTLRISIIKKLVKEKGFNVICFENPFGDSYFLNQVINSDSNLEGGMKEYMLSLWQTPEIRDFLYWLRDYNKKNYNKINFAGMDFNLMANAALIIKNEIAIFNDSNLSDLGDTLYNDAIYYDSIWNNQNNPEFNFDFDIVIAKMKEGYRTSKLIDSIVKLNKVQTSDIFKMAILNCKMWVSGEEGRDENMGKMVIQIAKDQKVIVWAHDLHLALKSVFNDNSVGGAGGFIKKEIPDYFVLGTGTASGSYSGTNERFDTRINVMESFHLSSATKLSWDQYFEKKNIGAFYIDMTKDKKNKEALPLRLIGYGPPERIEYSDPVNLPELYDAFIFIKETNASEHDL